MMPWSTWVAASVSFAGALLVSSLLTPVVRRWALKRDFVDRPSGEAGHKQHVRITALGGGIAITVAVLAPIAFALVVAALIRQVSPDRLGELNAMLPPLYDWAGGVVMKTPQALAILAGALVMHLTGIVDDHRPLSASTKLIVQLAVALTLTGIFGIRSAEALGPVPAVLLTSLWIVGLTNAFNFMDNIDGLTAGVAALTAVMMALAGMRGGQIFVPCLFLLLAGAAVGFLIYNFPPAKIFMGDAGSLVIGYLLAVFTVLTTFYDPDALRRPAGVLVPLVVFAIPIYDMISVIVYRLSIGVSIFRGDRRHFSHRLMNLGKSTRVAVLTIYLATLATALPAILLPSVNWSDAALILGQCICVISIIAILEARRA